MSDTPNISADDFKKLIHGIYMSLHEMPYYGFRRMASSLSCDLKELGEIGEEMMDEDPEDWSVSKICREKILQELGMAVWRSLFEDGDDDE